MASSTSITNTHENDVIFNMDSLREFIKLIKRQGTENIDFYAVSELLQPPGANAYVKVLGGTKDDNLEPWIELLNKSDRITAEETLQTAFNYKYDKDTGICKKDFSVEIWQYIPAGKERDYEYSEEKGYAVYSGWHTFREAVYKKLTKSSELVDSYVSSRNLEVNSSTGEYEWVENVVSPGFATQLSGSIENHARLFLNFSVYTKEADGTSYSMNYYDNLQSLLLSLSNQNSVDAVLVESKNSSESIKLYMAVPAVNTAKDTTAQLYFVIKANDKTNIQNVLNGYLNFNKAINVYKEQKLSKQYINKKISDITEFQGKNWWQCIPVKYNGNMQYETGTGENKTTKYYLEFNEEELNKNPGKIVVVRKIHPWQQDKTTDTNSSYDVNIKSGRHLYIQAGSLLKFNPGKSTEDKDQIDNYWNDNTAGTFSIDENDRQKAHIITIRGFTDGNFKNGNSGISGDRATPNIETTNLYAENGNFNNLKINGSSSDASKFLRGDTTWSNVLEGPLILGTNSNKNGRLVIYNTADTTSSGGNANTVSIHTLGGITADGCIYANKVYRAVFNDYAEFRPTIDLAPGHIVIESDDGKLHCTTRRLQPGAQVISDTYGDAMGYSDDCTTPIAVAGRVLVYTYQDRNNYHAGMAVCSAPNGTVDIMTREEIKEYPDCIIGIVSEIPNYEKWGSDQVEVNKRIWIKVR